ncbi:MAG: hypothetical protein AAGJ37_11605 [Pseudomonadota bacterium]
MNSSSVALPIEYKLENGQINKMNAEFLSLVGQLKIINDENFGSAFGTFVNCTEKQFAEKDDWMKASRFVNFQDYADEHSRVLSGLKTMVNQTQNGQLTFARAWIEEQALDWFTHRGIVMDKALSNHLQSLGSGGAAQPKSNVNRKYEENA